MLSNEKHIIFKKSRNFREGFLQFSSDFDLAALILLVFQFQGLLPI